MIYLAHNHKMLKADSQRPGRYFGWIYPNQYNVCDLDPFTIRVQLSPGYSYHIGKPGTVWTLVDEGQNIWDVTYHSTNWSSLFNCEDDDDTFQHTLKRVICANADDVTNMSKMFASHTSERT